MSFVRVNPSGLAVGQQMTSAMWNQMDIDHANALDKTIAGDTLSGTITMAAGSSILVSGAGANINTQIAGGIQSVVAAGMKSTVPGGFQLGGGSLDWPTVSPQRTRNIDVPIVPLPGLLTGWTASVSSFGAIVGPATTQGQALVVAMHNGATLSTLTAYIVVGSSHSGVPTNLPSLQIKRRQLSTGTTVDLSTTPSQAFPTPASGAAWFNGGAVQSWIYTANQNNVIDTTQFAYFIVLTDENGTNSIAGNLYFPMQVSYSAILNIQFE